MHLIVHHNGEPVKTYAFTEFPITIGRLQENQVPIADINISRRHVTVNRTGPGRYTAADMSSLNGTYVNKDRIEGERVLADGDRIILGSFQIEIHIQSEPDTLAVIEDISFPAPAGSEVIATTSTPIVTPVNVPPPAFQFEQAPFQGSAPVVFSSVVQPESTQPVAPPASDVFDEINGAVLIDTDEHIVYKLEKDITSIGNADSDDIFVEGMFISDNHVIVEHQPDGFWIIAKKKMGRFMVNGDKAARHHLAHKDRIEIGKNTFRFMENGQKTA